MRSHQGEGTFKERLFSFNICKYRNGLYKDIIPNDFELKIGMCNVTTQIYFIHEIFWGRLWILKWSLHVKWLSWSAINTVAKENKSFYYKICSMDEMRFEMENAPNSDITLKPTMRAINPTIHSKTNQQTTNQACTIRITYSIGNRASGRSSFVSKFYLWIYKKKRITLIRKAVEP